MKPVDAMWLRADRPENLMVVDALLWTDRPVDASALLDVVSERLCVYPVFSERPVEPATPFARPRWVPDRTFRPDRHVVRARLSEGAGEQGLRRYVEDQMSRPLPRYRPLWEMHLLDGCGEGSAVVCRFHHSLADGIALAQVLMSMTDPAPGARRRPAPAAARRPARSGGQRTRQVLHIADKLVLGHDPRTPLAGPPGVARRAAWSGPVPLADLKGLAHGFGATVNDVLVTAVAGAVARYLGGRGETLVALTTMVPVDVRPPGVPLPLELGNRFALVLLRLPTSQRDEVLRLLETARRMDAIKDSPEAVITFGLIRAIGVLDRRLARLAVDFFAAKSFGVTTNVIGPGEPRTLAGAGLTGVMGWVPGSGRHTLGSSIVSYAGDVRVGFKADARAVPDPAVLVHGVDDCLAELRRRAAVEAARLTGPARTPAAPPRRAPGTPAGPRPGSPPAG